MLKSFHACFRLGLLMSCQREAEEPDAARRDVEEEKASAVRKQRAVLLKKLTEAERRLMARWGPEAAETARRMVTVWLDEILVLAAWPGRELWLRKPLQSDWNEGRSGGLWFFQQIDILNPARRDDRELAALALRCLSLGLGGCHGREPEKLDQVRRQIQDRFALKDDSPIFPPALPSGGRKKTVLGPSGLKILAVLAAILLIIWVAGGFSLGRTLNRITAEAEANPASAARSLYGNFRQHDPPREDL